MSSFIRYISAVVCLVIFAGCQTNVSRFEMPGVDLSVIKRLCVDSTGDDRRSEELQILILQNLVSRGYQLVDTCAVGNDVGEEALLSYAADWHWDMTHYLVELRVALYEPNDRTLIAQAHSYQTSLVRRSMQLIVDRALAQLFDDQKPTGELK